MDAKLRRRRHRRRAQRAHARGLPVARRPQDRGARTQRPDRRRLHDRRAHPAGLSFQPAFQLLHGVPPFAADPRPRALSVRLLLHRAARPAGRGVPRRHLRRHPQGSGQELRVARPLLEAGRRDVSRAAPSLCGEDAPAVHLARVQRAASARCPARSPVRPAGQGVPLACPARPVQRGAQAFRRRPHPHAVHVLHARHHDRERAGRRHRVSADLRQRDGVHVAGRRLGELHGCAAARDRGVRRLGRHRRRRQGDRRQERPRDRGPSRERRLRSKAGASSPARSTRRPPCGWRARSCSRRTCARSSTPGIGATTAWSRSISRCASARSTARRISIPTSTARSTSSSGWTTSTRCGAASTIAPPRNSPTC